MALQAFDLYICFAVSEGTVTNTVTNSKNDEKKILYDKIIKKNKKLKKHSKKKINCWYQKIEMYIVLS